RLGLELGAFRLLGRHGWFCYQWGLARQSRPAAYRDACVPIAGRVLELRIRLVHTGELLPGDVYEAGLRIERHGLPVVRSHIRWTQEHRRVGEPRALGFDRPAGLLVQARGPGHSLRELFARDEFPGHPVEYVEEAILGRMHENGF